MHHGRPRRFIVGHHLRGERWRKGRYVNEHGYVMIRMPEHPDASSGFVREHRIVMERKLGRRLASHEHVHHLNGDKADNRPENLEMVDRAEHGRKHGRPKGIPHTEEYKRAQSERMKQWWAERKAHQ